MDRNLCRVKKPRVGRGEHPQKCSGPSISFKAKSRTILEEGLGL